MVDGVSPEVTNYSPNVGALLVTKDHTGIWAGQGLHGPMRNRDSDAVEQVVDGSSNTMLFGESLGAISNADTDPNGTIRDRRWSWVMNGGAVGAPTLVYSGITSDFGDANLSKAYHFGAKHTGVVNFVRADGSSMSMGRDVETETMKRLTGSADGLVIPEF